MTSSYRIDGDVAVVTLSKGRGEFVVDVADVDAVAAHGWDLGSKGYVIRTDRTGGVKRTVRLHRWLLGLATGDPRQADHIDGDPANNRRSNLRIAEPRENAQNRRTNRTSYSGIRGVGFRKDRRLTPWFAHIRIGGKQRILGFYATKEAAAEVAAAARAEHMPFAVER